MYQFIKELGLVQGVDIDDIETKTHEVNGEIRKIKVRFGVNEDYFTCITCNGLEELKRAVEHEIIEYKLATEDGNWGRVRGFAIFEL